jgi:hypothetical protein
MGNDGRVRSPPGTQGAERLRQPEVLHVPVVGRQRPVEG